MRIAIIAHDSRKELMAQFCTAYLRILSENELVATGVTGKIVHDATGLPVRCLYPGGRGGAEARERGAQALLYGHTHIPHIDYHDGQWLVNPGSIGDHRRPSYGVLTVEGDKLSPANFTLE